MIFSLPAPTPKKSQNLNSRNPSLLQWPYCTLHILRSNQRGEIIQRSKQYCIHREVPSVQAPKIGKRRGSNPRHKDRLCVSRGWIGRANHIQTFFPHSVERPHGSADRHHQTILLRKPERPTALRPSVRPVPEADSAICHVLWLRKEPTRTVVGSVGQRWRMNPQHLATLREAFMNENVPTNAKTTTMRRMWCAMNACAEGGREEGRKRGRKGGRGGVQKARFRPS